VPANLTPEYLAAEAAFRAAREPRAKTEALERMLRVVPKHKGTDHLRAMLRRKLSQARDEARQRKRGGGGRRVDLSFVPVQGTGQVAVMGPPNSGKSSLVDALTNARPEVAAYPFTTRRPQPAMMPWEDVQVQLVDCPPAGVAGFEGWLANLARRADAIVVVVDPSHPDALDDLDVLWSRLEGSKVLLTSSEEDGGAGAAEDVAGAVLDDEALLARLEPGIVERPVLMVASKADLPGREDDLEVFVELFGARAPVVAVALTDPEQVEPLRRRIFDMLGVIRVYTKPPGKEPRLHEPHTLPEGATVWDLARDIHKDIEANLRFARIWAEGYRDGQRVQRDHRLRDGDILELHA